MQTAAGTQQLVRHRERAGVGASAAEDERDEFVVAERGSAMTQQLLARPIVGRQVFHPTILT